MSLASTSSEETAFHTIALGELIVPGNTFSQHLMMRGQQPSLHPGWTTAVPDVYETAPLSVILAPMSFWRSHSGVPDVFFLPEARSLPHELLGERDHVEFR